MLHTVYGDGTETLVVARSGAAGGPPPPAPPRSFLTERGEFDPAPKEIELRPQGRPLTRLGSHLPQKTLGEVDFDPASDGSDCVRRSPPPPAPIRVNLNP
jgi:hypothetical protein